MVSPQVAAQLLALHPERRLVLGENQLPHGAPGHTFAKVQPPAGDTLLRHVVVFGGGEELDQDRLDRVLELLAQLMVMVVAASVAQERRNRVECRCHLLQALQGVVVDVEEPSPKLA